MRIACLKVENFILVRRAEMNLSGGFSVLTGETGAGKTMLLSALAAVVGRRIDWEVFGEARAVVEARFTGGEDITVKRELLGKSRRSRAWLNGEAITGTELALRLGPKVSIHGQRENQRLLDPDNHLLYLDAFGGLEDLRRDFALLWEKKGATEAEIAEKRREMARLREAEELYRFQLSELEDARLRAGEEEELLDARRVLSSGAALQEALNSVQNMLYEGEDSAYERITLSHQTLERFSDIGIVKEALESLAEASARVQDAYRLLADAWDARGFDPEELERIHERLFTIARLKEKYKRDVTGLMALAQEIREKLSRLETGDQGIALLEEDLAGLLRQIEEKGRALSAGRERAAAKLSQRVEEELSQLAMAGARFTVAINRAEASERGFERCEFLFSGGPGQPLLPLVKVASGGELSRIMLALETALAGADRTPVLVFDEVDQGIGGRVAEVVGRKLRDLSSSHQVIAVTHLPQIAARAQDHFLVEKKGGEVRINRLSAGERVREIARMAAGERITPEAVSLAKRLLAE